MTARTLSVFVVVNKLAAMEVVLENMMARMRNVVVVVNNFAAMRVVLENKVAAMQAVLMEWAMKPTMQAQVLLLHLQMAMNFAQVQALYLLMVRRYTMTAENPSVLAKVVLQALPVMGMSRSKKVLAKNQASTSH